MHRLPKRRRGNHIPMLLDSDGRPCTDHNGICSIVHHYFVNLFSTSSGSGFAKFDALQLCVTNEDSVQLMALFSIHEFRDAVFSMHSDKASGPDGMSLAFFQQFLVDYWR
ncbi:hypothetical protein ES319_D01G116500v1 [Gossypium barbadense]|uniref:Reverse transcriptase domain-containing protein n=2 Tax=Gossypium TaxID=3633 RepID=A0A5J5SMJ0_GOSBA|nr:hypothetical protein ES319_D01G116500v1 [Gossypium barbadense]TYG82919.1 hypothetical protein ES288_D01G127600v1 [Gossypium darwinii]